MGKRCFQKAFRFSLIQKLRTDPFKGSQESKFGLSWDLQGLSRRQGALGLVGGLAQWARMAWRATYLLVEEAVQDGNDEAL